MNKKLKKMSRQELVELLLAQSKAMDEMTIELAKKDELLKERNIKILESGSIAEASLKINEVFESCQKACDQYLDSIKTVRDESKVVSSYDMYSKQDEYRDSIRDNYGVNVSKPEEVKL